MTDTQYAEIDAKLEELGWLYNPATDYWEVTRGPEAGKVIYYQDMLAHMLHIPVPMLVHYCQRRKGELMK